jgi:hypothetical protein
MTGKARHKQSKVVARPNAVFLFGWTLDRNQNQGTAFDSSETCQCRRWKTIEEWAEDHEMTFAQAIRRLVELGLSSEKRSK